MYFNFINQEVVTDRLPSTSLLPSSGTHSNNSEGQSDKVPMASQPRSTNRFKFLKILKGSASSTNNPSNNLHSTTETVSNNKERDPIEADPVRASPQVKLIRSLRSKHEMHRPSLTSRNGSNSNIPKGLKLISEIGKNQTSSDMSTLSKNESRLKQVSSASSSQDKETQAFTPFLAKKTHFPPTISVVNISNISKASDYFPLNSCCSSFDNGDTNLIKQQTNSQQQEQAEGGTRNKRTDTITNVNQIIAGITEIKNYLEERQRTFSKQSKMNAQVYRSIHADRRTAPSESPPEHVMMVFRANVTPISHDIFS